MMSKFQALSSANRDRSVLQFTLPVRTSGILRWGERAVADRPDTWLASFPSSTSSGCFDRTVIADGASVEKSRY